jgi:tetratricopeptide (TPR) repeat protein
VLRRAGRQKEAIAELRELSREHPTDLAIQGAMADAAIEAGDPETFLEATEELAGPDDRPGVLVLYLRALAQKALGRHGDAIDSLDRALEIAPGSAEIRALRDRFEAERRGGQRT